MKLLIIILFSSFLFSTQYEDVIYLKDGSVIHGTIVENKFNEYCKINSEGNLFTFEMDRIDTIKKEPLIQNDKVFEEKNTENSNQKVKPGEYSPFGFRIGLDMIKEIDIEGFSEDIDANLTMGYDTFINKIDSGFGIGFEYVYPAQIEDLIEEIDIISCYTFYALKLNSTITPFFKIGYNLIGFDAENNTEEYPEGGYGTHHTESDIMYGFGVAGNTFQVSYTIHNGTLIYEEWDDSIEFDLEINRLNISYTF